MPEYSLQCEKCENKFSKIWSISEYNSKFTNVKCPFCLSKKIVRDYQEDNVSSNYIKGLHECTTLGEYADKQTKKYGKAKCEAMQKSFKTQKDPNTGIKDLPAGMTRAKDYDDTPKLNEKRRIQ